MPFGMTSNNEITQNKLPKRTKIAQMKIENANPRITELIEGEKP